MDEGQNNANKANGSSAAGSQGIFSTPELTVDAEKLAQNKPTNDKSRVASIFANTDAGQRSQKLNDAMGVSAQPATEDLVIQNEPRKRSKAPIILALVTLIAVIGGLVGWFVVSNISNQQQVAQTPFTAFEKFTNLLQYGPSEKKEDNASSEETPSWFVSTLSSSELTSSERDNYIKNLLVAFQDFSSQTKNLPNLNENSQAILTSYKKSMRAYLTASSLAYYSQQLISKFLEGGKQATTAFINELTPEEFESGISAADALNREARAYLTTEANVIEIYKNANCIKDNIIIPACSADTNINSTALPEAYNQQEEQLSAIDFYLPTAQVQLVNLTPRIINILKELQNES